MRPLYYKLVDHEPVPIPMSEIVYSILWERIAYTPVGGVYVSTVFCGFDGSPISMPRLFETAIIGGFFDGRHWRVETYVDALAVHAEATRLVRRYAWVPLWAQVPWVWNSFYLPLRLIRWSFR